MKKLTQFLMAVVFALVATTLTVPDSSAQAQTQTPVKNEFTVAWSTYVTWNLTPFLRDSGLLKKWGDKYGIVINITPMMAYLESYTQFTNNKVDAVMVTNMDAMMGPSFGGVDSEFITIQDYSDGNDSALTRTGTTMADLIGRKIFLLMGSVSQFLVGRCVEMAGMKMSDITLVNANDENELQNMFSFTDDPNLTVCTWNPIVQRLRGMKNSRSLCNSSQIPGEIMDGPLVRKDADERFKMALTGAYYEGIAMLAKKGASHNKVVASAAKVSECTVPEYEGQLKTTALFMNPQAAFDFLTAPGFRILMQTVQRVTYELKMYEPKTQGAVGIELPDGTILGDKSNVRLHFTTKYVKMAIDGKL